MLVFPPERFDLDVAAALGKRDWDHVVRRSDNLTGAMRDKIQRDGASWIAPLEFLSEVFVDGKPLTKQSSRRTRQPLDGVRSLDVHFPRFGDGDAARDRRQGPVRHVARPSAPSAPRSW